ncbi:2-oxoglutarate dehydrogenase E1 component [Chondromyces crocatus]|uniref:oxoglutarate dehydrogenase (succinyl-transferring) n=1 Tax=Chondromyces crocatus TaxID=52 RepID=A0A0K1EE89_CHOCO|nr:2-oxoglutarate dehydrogenase E1 component [Chondromyces crocatus]AKT39164.1 2-oxoglutarate dehydrogenase E1 [Chondromyces crocatus]
MQLDFGVNAGFVEELYAQFVENPASVDPSWRAFFEANGANGHGNGHGNGAGPTLSVAQRRATAPAAAAAGREEPQKTSNDAQARELETAFAKTLSQYPAADTTRDLQVLAQGALQARAYALMNAYRVRGHLFAHLDPLNRPPGAPPELDLTNFGLSIEDLDKPFPTGDIAGVPPVLTLREIIQHLSETYCRTIGVEFNFIEVPEERNWLQQQMESTRNRLQIDREKQLRILTKLSDAEIFEQFIHVSYGAGTKRFSLEGAESLIPLLDLLIEHSGDHDVREIVMGMAHRGRLNVLVNIMDKSIREIFAAFEDKDGERNLGSGDVKYHLGYSTDRKLENGRNVHLTMTFNPSHLEFVNPVVEGRTRAKQDRLLTQEGNAEETRRQVMPLLIHGDAAFIGQGVVAETLNMMSLDGYATGGTVHVIVNNQVGFTTMPHESRSTRYASDIVRMLKVPVFHVNGEDPEAVTHVAQLAIDWRQRFGKDVVIDMYCYRKYGHNEGDEPRFTQPKMYQAIDKKPTVRQAYVQRLVEMGQVTEAAAEELVKKRREVLTTALDEVKQKGFAPVTYSMAGVWTSYRGGPDAATPEVDTAVPAEKLIALSEQTLVLPAGFKAHPKVLPLLNARHERLIAGESFDWGTGEMLAYASLLSEKASVRISGQDAQRGTFSHRHAVLSDVETGDRFAPLGQVAEWPARFEVFNSPLSEAGVLGFDLGYSLDHPDGLVIWEAQFGDFLNGAQVIIDQFLTSSEDKWHRLSGLVLYLPHGYEGQGPEHSSARMERFLQNSAEDNVQVCNLTTPAQLFHALRRQVHRPWRKPLVIFTPKSLLRVAASSKGPHRPVSTLKDLSEGRFHRVLPDTGGVDPTEIRKILLCSGKVYYDLAIARDERKANDVAILRLEQLYPINDELVQALASYKDGTKLVWVQEEPLNYGGWYYINAVLPQILGDRFPLSCAGRAPSASPATGSKAAHLIEQKMLVDEAFGS